MLTRDEKIAKLGKVITDRATVLLGKDKITPDSPEYWGINSALKFTLLALTPVTCGFCFNSAISSLLNNFLLIALNLSFHTVEYSIPHSELFCNVHSAGSLHSYLIFPVCFPGFRCFCIFPSVHF